MKKIFGGTYSDLWKAVIRPPRDDYTDEELGPESFTIKEKDFQRIDFSIKNKKGFNLSCSIWEPVDEQRISEKLPCIIYLHGNCSSRTEVFSELEYLLPLYFCVVAFDFAGCGRSEGNYISLGYNEKEDLQCVIEILRRTVNINLILGKNIDHRTLGKKYGSCDCYHVY
jgi:pimeloyl-ACP methyl ester carboxylesterase